jgi:hypothetical protein
MPSATVKVRLQAYDGCVFTNGRTEAGWLKGIEVEP